MKKFKIYKAVLAFMVLILSCFGFINSVYAIKVHSADIYSIGECGSLLKYKGGVVKVSYVQYVNNGIEYPAYCLDKTKPGAETTPYNVSIPSLINDVGLWRRVINGYPYKTIEELGVDNKLEAFTATKQAIYCYIHGNNPYDYEAIGEAGERTLNAMMKIIEDSQNSKETKISNNIDIKIDDGKWDQDTIDQNYMSKEFSISSSANIKNYKIELINENRIDIGGIKLTNLENQEKDEFSPNERFKILIPIKNLNESGSIKIKVNAQMATKPVLYGIAPDSSYQDYALTAEIYEDSSGEVIDYYSKNETEIIIVKFDSETKKPLENVAFDLLDENKNVVYTGLKTDKDGKIIIGNLIPGKYFIKEAKTLEGYQANEECIEAEVLLHQQLTVNVYNNKEEKPKVEIQRSEKTKEVKTKEIKTNEVKKLPVTGM